MRVGRVGHLYVDSQKVQSGSTPGIFARLNLDNNLYLGKIHTTVWYSKTVELSITITL